MENLLPRELRPLTCYRGTPWSLAASPAGSSDGFWLAQATVYRRRRSRTLGARTLGETLSCGLVFGRYFGRQFWFHG